MDQHLQKCCRNLIIITADRKTTLFQFSLPSFDLKHNVCIFICVKQDRHYTYIDSRSCYVIFGLQDDLYMFQTSSS